MDEVRDVRCRYFCMSCGHEWTERFEEHLHLGRGGDEIDVFLHRGMPHCNPAVDTVCSVCGDLRVRLLHESVRSIAEAAAARAQAETVPAKRASRSRMDARDFVAMET